MSIANIFSHLFLFFFGTGYKDEIKTKSKKEKSFLLAKSWGFCAYFFVAASAVILITSWQLSKNMLTPLTENMQKYAGLKNKQKTKKLHANNKWNTSKIRKKKKLKSLCKL